MKRLFTTMVALVALLMAAPDVQAADWYNVISAGGETIAVNPEITTVDNGATYLVWVDTSSLKMPSMEWVRNSFDTPEARAEYSREREYKKPVAYKLTLYKFMDNWKKFNIVQVSVFGEDGIPIEQYSNSEAESGEGYLITPDTDIEIVAQNAKVIYEITTNPE